MKVSTLELLHIWRPLATAVELTIVDVLQELAGLGDRHVQQLLLPLGSDNES